MTATTDQTLQELLDLHLQQEASLAGRKDDNGKDRWDLLPLAATQDVVKVLTYGAAKYSAENWRAVPDAYNRYYAAAMRHISAWRLGYEIDPESGLPHLAHATCCLLFLATFDSER